MNFLDEWVNIADGHANSLKKQDNPARGIFVVGTDTEVGKTYVSCLLIQQLVRCGMRVGAYKPVASGVVSGQPGDAELLNKASGASWPLDRVCPQSFAAPLAPPLAAARVGLAVDDVLLLEGADWWHGRCDALVVEGAGGVLSPVSDRSTVLDIAAKLQFPLVVVAAHRLGMINHTLLTLEAIERRGLTTLALVVNEVADPCSRDGDAVQLAESLALLKTFCSYLSCWTLAHRSDRFVCSGNIS